MALQTRPDEEQTAVAVGAPDHTWRWVLLALVGIAVAARVLDPMQIPWLRSLLIVFGSLLIEAMPFVAIGAAVSAAIEVFVPSSTFAKIGSLPRAAQIPAAAIAGMAFPVCECGSVPVARRLARKGLGGRVVGVETADKMTAPQIAAKVREHFGEQLRTQQEEAWQQANRRLYHYYRNLAPPLPETFGEMEPLFLAVVCGCRARNGYTLQV